MEKEKLAGIIHIPKETEEIKFDNSTVPQQLKVLNNAIDENIRMMLHQDGGDCSIEDIKKIDNIINVYLRYLGNCSGCGGAAGTLQMIEVMLHQHVSQNIRIISI